VHPLLARPASLAVYLIAWIPLTAILGALLVLSSGMSALEAAVVSPLLTGVYAFVCLSSWYLCIAFPIRTSRLFPLAVTLAVASIVAAALWVLWGATLGGVLALAPPFAALPESLRRATPVVLLVGILLYLLAVALHYLLAAARDAKEREEREAELKSLARDAELSALKERLNPHFLFNALNSIASLAATRPDEARRMCALLSDFLRTTLGYSFAQDQGVGRVWSPMAEVIVAKPKDGDAEWDVVPQMQVTLSKLQHILLSVGVRVPVNERQDRKPQVLTYVVWDWFDGGLFQFWK